jgi:hypothetical protein
MSHVLRCSEGSGLQGCQQVSRLLQLFKKSFHEIAATSHKDCYLSIIGWHTVSSSPNDSFASGESLIDFLGCDNLKGLSADSVVASFPRFCASSIRHRSGIGAHCQCIPPWRMLSDAPQTPESRNEPPLTWRRTAIITPPGSHQPIHRQKRPRGSGSR